jgi:HSP20 family protein
MTTTRLRGPVIDIAEATDTTERAFDDRLAQILWPWIDEDARPALDLCVTDASVVAKVALPGVAPETIDVRISGDLVTVHGSGTPGSEQDGGYVQHEISRGSIRRTFAVPVAVDADAATASFVGGLLTLTVPRREDGASTRGTVRRRSVSPAR